MRKIFNFFNFIKDKRPKRTVSAAELLKDRPMYSSNISLEDLMWGPKIKHLELFDSEVSAQRLRINLGRGNKYDNCQEKIYSNLKGICRDYHNYPYELINLYNDNKSEYFLSVKKLNNVLNKILPKEKKNEFTFNKINQRYKECVNYQKNDEMKNRFDELSNYIEQNKDLVKKVFEMDRIDLIKLVEMTNNRLCNLIDIPEEKIKERMKYNNYNVRKKEF